MPFEKRKEKKTQEEYIKQAAKNVSKAEIAAFRKFTEKYPNNLLAKFNEEEIRIHIARSHSYYPICHNCLKKGEGVVLKSCAKCLLIFYCSVDCQKKHWKREHKKTCCNPDAPFSETDPYAIVLIQVDKEEISPFNVGDWMNYAIEELNIRNVLYGAENEKNDGSTHEQVWTLKKHLNK